MSVEAELEPSVNLVNEAQNHLAFLRSVDEDYHYLKRVHVIRNAVRRYENHWLPLIDGVSEPLEFEPPLDVHWIWHVHMLCPPTYRMDCELLIGKVLDHGFHATRPARDAAMKKAETLWRRKYSEEPFEVEYDTIAGDYMYKPRSKYDLVAAASRQLDFYYNVSLPHYGMTDFLIKAVERYKKFINLKKQNQSAFVVPMYDVDLIWHTHQLKPFAYDNDMESFLGYILNHDDTSSDRSPTSKLSQGDAITRSLWLASYKEHFAVPGVAYRGTSPRGRLGHLYATEISQFLPKTCLCRIDRIDINGSLKEKYKVAGRVVISKTAKREFPRRVALGLRKQPPFFWEMTAPAGIITFQLDSRYPGILELNVSRKDGIKGFIVGKVLVNRQFKMSDELEKACTGYEIPRNISIRAKTQEGVDVKLACTISDVRFASETLHLYKDPFEEVTLPEDLEQLWGPIKLPRLPTGVANTCQAATHTLKTERGVTVFSVRVIHSIHLRQSVVQIFYKDKMMAISHLIGSEQLPTPDQVGRSMMNKCMTLDQKLGERAMLIKNDSGDWGIVKASWVGYRRGRMKNPAVKGVRGDPGTLRVTFYNCKKDTRTTCSLMERRAWVNERSKSFHLENIEVDLRTGDITFKDGVENIAEHVALAFSVVILFVMCEPRPVKPPSRYEPPAPITRNFLSGKKRQGVETLDAFDNIFMLAAGYWVAAPSNSWLFWNDHWEDHDAEQDLEVSYPGMSRDQEICPCTDIGVGDGSYCPWGGYEEEERDVDSGLSDAGSDGQTNGYDFYGMDNSECGGCGGSCTTTAISSDDTGYGASACGASGETETHASCGASCGGGGGGDGGGGGSSCGGSSCGGGGGGWSSD